jgi:hypothetical protein
VADYPGHAAPIVLPTPAVMAHSDPLQMQGSACFTGCEAKTSTPEHLKFEI